MLLQATYYYQVNTNQDNITIVVRNNFGQQEIIRVFLNKDSVDTELANLKNRLNTTGLYSNGLFYPKTGELISRVLSRPIRKKILIDNEYLRS